MTKFVFRAPGRYVQGAGVLSDLAQEAGSLGQSHLLISDDTVWELTQETVEKSFEASDSTFDFIAFNGESSAEEIKRLAAQGMSNKNETVIGIGGGKAIDTAKAVADDMKVPVIIVPTIVSTDAPTSALSVIYTDEGQFESYRLYDENPNLVLVDTEVVIGAPARLFASGIADAMATLVEARASVASKADTMAGGKATLAAQAITEMAESILFDYGIEAFKAVEANILTPQVEKVIEANTLLSGLGFENGGLSAAHAVHNGFTAIEGKIHELTHGEKVAYGTLVQLVLEGRSLDEVTKYVTFYRQIDMPVSLEEMHLEDVPFEDLVKIGEAATAEGETMANLDPEITGEEVAQAILAVDKYSQMI